MRLPRPSASVTTIAVSVPFNSLCAALNRDCLFGDTYRAATWFGLPQGSRSLVNCFSNIRNQPRVM